MFTWEKKFRCNYSFNIYIEELNIINRYLLKESISTCRFAQRVALIKNEALVNEELDPRLIINRLKREVEELKNQLAISQTEYNAAELTSYETEK